MKWHSEFIFQKSFLFKHVKTQPSYKKRQPEINIQNQMQNKRFQDLEMEQKCKSVNKAEAADWRFDYFHEKMN